MRHYRLKFGPNLSRSRVQSNLVLVVVASKMEKIFLQHLRPGDPMKAVCRSSQMSCHGINNFPGDKGCRCRDPKRPRVWSQGRWLWRGYHLEYVSAWIGPGVAPANLASVACRLLRLNPGTPAGWTQKLRPISLPFSC